MEFSNGSLIQMLTKIPYLLAVLTVLSGGLSHVQGDVDCNERPPYVDVKTCCPMPNFITEDITKKCRQLNNMPPPPPSAEEEMSEEEHRHHKHHKHHHHHHHPHHHCYSSCVLNETEILVDGKMDEGNLDIYLDTNLADVAPEMKEVMKKAFQECYNKADEIMEKLRKHFEKKETDHCSPKSSIILGCTMMNTFKQCPDSVWSDTDECNTLRDFLIECKPKFEKKNEE